MVAIKENPGQQSTVVIVRPQASVRFQEHADGAVTYTVQPGDSLKTIATEAFKFAYQRNPRLHELCSAMLHIDKANGLNGEGLVRAGQVLEWRWTLRS